MRAIEFSYNIFNEKLFGYDPDSGEAFDAWGYLFYMFKEGSVAMFTAYTWAIMDELAFSFATVPFPKGPDYAGATWFTGLDQGMVIPRGSVKPEDCWEVYEQHHNWFGNDYEARDDINFAWELRYYPTEKDAIRINNAANNESKLDVADSVKVDGIGYGWILNGFTRAFYEQTGTPAQVVEEARQVRQDMLDTVFGQLEGN
jgi:hypothetical protein